MKKKIFLASIILWGVCFMQSFASFGTYDIIYQKLQQKVTREEQMLPILRQLENALEEVMQTSSQKNKILFQTLIIANQQRIATLEEKYAGKTSSPLPFQTHATRPLPKHIQLLIDEDFSFVELNSQGEFTQNGETYRANIEGYYEITPKNAHLFLKKDKAGIVFLVQGKYIFTREYTFEQKKTFEDLKYLFTHTLDTSHPFSLSGGAYWGYKYVDYIVFRDDFGIYESDLAGYDIDQKKTLFVQDGDQYFFVKDYQTIRLIDDTIITSITNKDRFLQAVFDDNRFFVGNYDDVLLRIKSQTQALIRGTQTDREKIQRIYLYLLENLTYYSDFRDGNRRIFSGVHTFQDQKGVCDGFTKLFLYMLSFAKIDDAEIITGYVFDSMDFPDFGHAWVRIGNGYYDPSFDVSFEKDGEKHFFYFDIPRELILTNRFEGFDIPQGMKNMSLPERRALAAQNMHDIAERYEKYELTNSVKNTRTANPHLKKTISFDEVTKNIGFIEVKNGFLQTDPRQYVFSVKYYQFHAENYLGVLGNPKVDLSGCTLLKRYLDDEHFEYRLAYEIFSQ